jgi:hypothetical protein
VACVVGPSVNMILKIKPDCEKIILNFKFIFCELKLKFVKSPPRNPNQLLVYQEIAPKF